MDYENVYYVTPDGRNAVVTDHRTQTTLPARRATVVHSASAPPAAAAPATISSTVGPYQYQYQAPQAPYYASAIPTTQWAGYPTNPAYVTAPVMSPASNLATILGGFGDIGTLAKIAADVFAAFIPLPAAPDPQDKTDTADMASTNAAVNSSNLIRYQSALAQFARRDQQILTLGSVLKELFRRPGVF